MYLLQCLTKPYSLLQFSIKHFCLQQNKENCISTTKCCESESAAIRNQPLLRWFPDRKVALITEVHCIMY